MSTMHKLRTVDLWDTLIRRHCHPECIKLSVAHHVYLRCHEKLREPFRDPWKLYGERLALERAIAAAARARGGDDEYVLEEVLQQWLQRTLAITQDEAAKLAHEVAVAEFEIECSRSFADPDIREFLQNYPATQTIFLSDFYMTSDNLSRLLAHHGLSDMIAGGVSSCETGLNKRSGRLFSHIHEQFKVTASEHIHIGDNSHADVSMPEQLGIRAIHYLPQTAHRARQERERLFSSRSELFSHVQKQAASEAAVYVAKSGAADQAGGAAFHAGVQAAPLFIGFSLFIAENALRDKVEKIFFQTREGEFFARVFAALFPDAKLAGIPLPPTALLEVSRLATFTASLREISVAELSRIWRLIKRQSMAALFKTLGLTVEEFLPVLARCGLSTYEPIERPAEDARVGKLLRDPDFRRALKDKIARDRTLLLAYLDEKGMLDAKRVGLVDIGWRGTIQDNLARLAPQVFSHGYYLGLQRYLNPQPDGAKKIAFGPDANSALAGIHLLDAFVPLEMLCTAETGSVETYIRTASGIQAQRRIDETENRAFEQFSKMFQAGVVFASETWRPYMHHYAVLASELHGPAMTVWNRLGEQSSGELVEAFLNSSQNDVFGFGEFLDKREVPSMAKIFRGVFKGDARRDVMQYIVRTQWSAPIRHCKDISALHRGVLLSLFAAARRYKHLRTKYVYRKSRNRNQDGPGAV